MRKMKLGKSDLAVPVIGIGVMRMGELKSIQAAADFISTAIENGANFFDHADIYGAGKCEEMFAESLKITGTPREKIFLQSKCGIIKGKQYDSSKAHILEAVDNSLKRLKTDYLDVLLIHRPDALVEPEQVAEAFDILEANGKVRNFGVSNHNPMQIRLLQKFVKQTLVANQMQFSITNATMITSGMNVNLPADISIDRDGSVLDFCRLNDITIQPWSPFQYARLEGSFLNNDKFFELNRTIDAIAQKYGVTNNAIVIAWILKHPAKMQPIVGTMNTKRLEGCIKGTDITITRDEWYDIYKSAGYQIL